MAVRTSFTAGEVLAAADLTDTFGAKGNLASPTFTGTPAAPTATAGTNTTQLATTAFVLANSAAGLVHINTTTFSAVSSVSINNVFTSDYDSYRIIFNFTKSVAGFVGGRLRASGTDSVTGYLYANLETTAPAGGPTIYANNAASAFDFGTKSNVAAAISMDINNPAVAVATNESHTGPGGQAGTLWWSNGSGFHNVATAYDGFTLFIISGGGTFTGTIRAYGYQNS